LILGLALPACATVQASDSQPAQTADVAAPAPEAGASVSHAGPMPTQPSGMPAGQADQPGQPGQEGKMACPMMQMMQQQGGMSHGQKGLPGHEGKMACPMMQMMQQGGMSHGQKGQPGQEGKMACPMMQMMQQQGGMSHGKSAHKDQTQDANPVIRACAQAKLRMHQGMAFEFSGNADQDFLHGMIAHHQGGIDLAKVALEHGQDPRVRKLARRIIAAQEKELAQMKAWQAKPGPAPVKKKAAAAAAAPPGPPAADSPPAQHGGTGH
jgi:uncharacterized protein (DUF305 family)